MQSSPWILHKVSMELADTWMMLALLAILALAEGSFAQVTFAFRLVRAEAKLTDLQSYVPPTAPPYVPPPTRTTTPPPTTRPPPTPPGSGSYTLPTTQYVPPVTQAPYPPTTRPTTQYVPPVTQAPSPPTSASTTGNYGPSPTSAPPVYTSVSNMPGLPPGEAIGFRASPL